MAAELVWCAFSLGQSTSIFFGFNYLVPAILNVVIPAIIVSWMGTYVLSKKLHDAGRLLGAAIIIYILSILVIGPITNTGEGVVLYLIFALPFAGAFGLIPTTILALHLGRKISQLSHATINMAWVLIILGVVGVSIPSVASLGENLVGQQRKLQHLTKEECSQRGGTPDYQIR